VNELRCRARSSYNERIVTLVLPRISVYMVLPNVVIMDFTGLNLKYFAYFTTDKDTRLNVFSQNSNCGGRFSANEARTRREQTFRFSAAIHYLTSQQIKTHALMFSLRTAVVVGDSSPTKPAPAGNKHSVFPLPFITLFHNRFSKCRSPASNQVFHILKISVDIRGRSRIEILAISFR